MENPLSPDIWTALHADRKTLTTAQEQRFLEVARQFPADTRVLCELLYWTGCRISEALALRRDYVDSQLAFVVLRTLKQRRNDSLRAVPVPRSFISLLLALPAAENGRFWPYSRWTAQRRIKPVMLAAGITGVAANSKALRHSYNARGIRSGTPDRIRRCLLGHRTQRANDHYGELVGYELRDHARAIWETE